MLCRAKTRSGGICQLKGNPKNGRCHLHGGASTGPRTAEGRSRIAAAQYKHGGGALKHLWPLSGLEKLRARQLNVS